MSIERDLISAVHSNHSEITPDFSLIYEPCHSQKSINRALISPRKGTQGNKARGEEKKKKRREEGKEGRNSSSTTAGFSSDAGILSEFQITPEFCPTSKRGQNSARLPSDARVQSNSQVTSEFYKLCVTGYQSEANTCNLIVLNFKDKSVYCISSKH
ncbi:hypothetical protein M5K25_005516 [Dendrobium thyrsiflorum]|uniref:Uncharacterized protein n=1 Tax=Dendrobium thyrsiflorum TaxID=117978 RepID=A0ABD0VPY0_DENTH